MRYRHRERGVDGDQPNPVDGLRPHRPGASFKQIVLAAGISALLTGGGVGTLLGGKSPDQDRRLNVLEETSKEDHDLLHDVAKDVEWLVRNAGGVPVKKKE